MGLLSFGSVLSPFPIISMVLVAKDKVGYLIQKMMIIGIKHSRKDCWGKKQHFQTVQESRAWRPHFYHNWTSTLLDSPSLNENFKNDNEHQTNKTHKITTANKISEQLKDTGQCWTTTAQVSVDKFRCTIRFKLTHWGQDKMAAISQMIFSNAFSWMKTFDFQIFHWSAISRV